MTDPSTTPPDPAGPARVLDHRRLPPGVIPRHLQQWVLIATAVGMVAILAIVRPPTRSQPTAPPAALAVDVNQQRIEDFQRRIQEQAERLAAEQAQLEATKEAIATPGVAAPRRPASDAAVSAPSPVRPRELPVAPGRVADSLVFVRDQPPATPAVIAFPPVPDATVGALPPTLTTPAVASDAPVPPGPAVAAPAAAAVPPPPRPAARALASSTAPTYTLYEGTVIETVLTNRLDGTFSGPVNCLVSVPVYAQDRLVIPAGARVLGEARAVSTFGQSRLAVTFHRVLLPNQTSVDLDEVPGLNQAGDLGLADQVNRHYAQVFGASLALGAIAGFAQAGTGYGFDATSLDAYRQGIASNVSQSSTRVLDRFLNLLPTVTIREGHRIKVYLTRDLSLPAYRPAASARGGRP
jgi:type IV secretion system protein VirB10